MSPRDIPRACGMLQAIVMKTFRFSNILNSAKTNPFHLFMIRALCSSITISHYESSHITKTNKNSIALKPLFLHSNSCFSVTRREFKYSRLLLVASSSPTSSRFSPLVLHSPYARILLFVFRSDVTWRRNGRNGCIADGDVRQDA